MTLDVNGLERGGFRSLEEAGSLAGKKSHFAVLLSVEKALSAAITDKSSAFIIGFEAEFLCDESQPNINFVAASMSADSSSKTPR